MIKSVGATAQDRRIARLEAEATGVSRHIGAALVDDSDDTDRHGNARNFEAVGPVQRASTRPTGSGSAAIFSSPPAIASRRSGVSFSLSVNEAFISLRAACSMSLPLAARMLLALRRSAAAMAASAADLLRRKRK